MYWWLLYPVLLLTAFLSLVDLRNGLMDNYGRMDFSNQNFPKTNAKPQNVIMPQKPDETTYPGLLFYQSSNSYYDNPEPEPDPEDYFGQFNGYGLMQGSQAETPVPTTLSTEFAVQLEQERHRLIQEFINTTSHKKKPSNSTPPKNPNWTLAQPNPKSPGVNFGAPTLLPPLLPDKHKTTTILLIMSAPANFVRRQAIRQTWKQQHTNVVFIIGQSSDIDIMFLQHEQDLYQDLVEIPMLDDYTLLPEKLVQAYAWALETFSHLEWLAKVDDDNFVKPQSLEKYLQKYNSNLPMLVGKIVPHSPVAKEGKWADMEYEQPYYPYWPQGSCGHIVSKVIAKYIVKHSSKLHRYQGEDVSLGIWLDEAHTSHALKDLTYIQAESMMTFDGSEFCSQSEYLIVGHDLSPDAILQCYQQQSSAPTTDQNKKTAWVDSPAKFEHEMDEDEAASFMWR
jgi:hypothetical protein